MGGKYANCIRLNLRMLRNLLSGRVMTEKDCAAGYDSLAEDYDSAWLKHLASTTEKMLELLPPPSSKYAPETILDLGCGTGFSTALLERKYPDAKITGVDISQKMLDEAQKRCAHAEFKTSGMLEFLKKTGPETADIIVSAWAVGYVDRAKLFKECARILKRGGIFCFTVNTADTLPKVFYAYRRTLAEHSQKVQKALFPDFPENSETLSKILKKNGFDVTKNEDGAISVPLPPEGKALPWLLKTGILAGFDSVLPLSSDPAVAEYFEREFYSSALPLEHRYAMMTGVKK